MEYKSSIHMDTSHDDNEPMYEETIAMNDRDSKLSICEIARCTNKKPSRSFDCKNITRHHPDQNMWRVHNPAVCGYASLSLKNDPPELGNDRNRHQLTVDRQRRLYNSLNEGLQIPQAWIKFNYDDKHWDDEYNIRDYLVHLKEIKEAPDTCQPSTHVLLQHQALVKLAFRPCSPLRRLLVIHPTGSGKTRSMVEVLNNFFYSPTATIMVVPNETVMFKAYQSILTQLPGSKLCMYIKSISNLEGLTPKNGPGILYLDTYQTYVKHNVNKKVQPFFEAAIYNGATPNAPIIILRYEDLCKVLRKETNILDSIFHKEGKLNINDMTFLFDEAHRIHDIQTNKIIQTMVIDNPTTSCAYFTATPWREDSEQWTSDPKLKIFSYDGGKNFRPFVFHHENLTSLYYEERLKYRTQGDFQSLDLYNQPNTWDYREEVIYNLASPEQAKKFSNAAIPQKPESRKIIEFINDTMFFPCAHAIAKKIIEQPEQRSLIVSSYRNGIGYLCEILHIHNIKALVFSNDAYRSATPDGIVSTTQILELFNDTKNSTYHVLVIDTDVGGEALDVFGIDNVYSMNYYENINIFKQVMGRVNRMCDDRSHKASIDVYLFTIGNLERTDLDEDILPYIKLEEPVYLYALDTNKDAYKTSSLLDNSSFVSDESYVEKVYD